MSAPEERPAPTSRPSPDTTSPCESAPRETSSHETSLHDYALFRHGIEPDGRVPARGYPLPDGPPEPSRPRLTLREAQEEVASALADTLADPDPVRAAAAVHRRVRSLVMPHRTLRACVIRLPLTDEAAARRTGRRLVRTGTTPAAVQVGLGLLSRLGEPEDAPWLTVLGLLKGFERPVVAALDRLDRQAAALLMLRTRVRDTALYPLLDAVEAGDDAAVLAALTGLPPDFRTLGCARRIAEAADLHRLLRAHPRNPALLARAAGLLHRMAGRHDVRAEILDYGPATDAYETLISHADLLPATPGHRAVLLSIALDLHSGPAALLDWRPGRREVLLDALGRLPAAPAPGDAPGDPAERRRADWMARTGRQPFRVPPDGERLRIEVVAEDPADRNDVETRILVDGRPLVPALFGKGPGTSPERLLDTGLLRAGSEPREVRLAEAYCSEGCCGALDVTIRREGEEVVWGDWRGAVGPPPPEYRFDAAGYDAELERADRDRPWSWPARSTARLVADGLRERPDLLTRWDALPGWVGTAWDEPDTVEVYFTYWPGLAAGNRDREGPWLQFGWRIPQDGGPVGERAAAVLDRLASTDPKTYAEVRGGSREHAEALGHPWPERG
ncbi:hypothetical protein ACIRO3_32175 [Streptomyces sp. NPDC102278]|uniref:hypothetical protein n=1 Tax=Streptomyces sp. NPDC102278 TaxID=3366152 RepID=UPI00382A1679